MQPTTSTDIGYFGPDSVTWRVMSEPVTFVGGLRALLLEGLHPEAMALLEQKTSYRDDPWTRLQHTGEFIATVTFAATEEADRAAARVRGIHRRLGITDPALLAWIHNAEVDSMLTVARRSGVDIDAADADRYVCEQAIAGALVGLPEQYLLQSNAQLQAYLHDMRPALALTPGALRGARMVLAPPMPARVQLLTPARIGWTALASMAVGLLPRWARRMYRLPGLPIADVTTTAALRALRVGARALPATLREGPHYRAAQQRLAQHAG